MVKEFIDSLTRLNLDGLTAHFMLIDDNDDVESQRLLDEIAAQTTILVHRLDEVDVMQIPSRGNETMVDQQARRSYLKNSFIEVSREENYDYLFLIDSHVLLHPDTVLHLLSLNKDIISPIYWSNRQGSSEPMPQVWLKDQQLPYNFSQFERLTNEELLTRKESFVNALKNPGVYQVGGVTGGILISQEAIRKGVNFTRIDNLSFVGEDIHFSIRASALGFPLYVSTHYSGFEMKEGDDLAEAREFQAKSQVKTSKKRKITLVYSSLSGANTISLYKLAPAEVFEQYDIQLIHQDISEEYLMEIATSDLVIINDGNYPFDKEKVNKDQIVFELWHGFPLKQMGYVDPSEINKELLVNTWKNVTYLSSYSDLFTELMDKCVRIGHEKYVVTGSPRNDMLYLSEGRKLLETILKRNLEGQKVIFYMPTYRSTARYNRIDGDRKWNNLFDFAEFDDSEFDSFLVENNMILVLKIHPAEESIVRQKISGKSNVIILTTSMLAEVSADLYEVLNAADLLMTDYSSVYFDYLLLDRPIVFVPCDLEAYAESRGFMLNPYDEWTPGPKVFEQHALQEELIKSLHDPDYYKMARDVITNHVHSYKDYLSSQRIWQMITTKLLPGSR